MWSRVELKERAKGILRYNYGKAFLISLVIVIASGGGSSAGSARGGNSGNKANNFGIFDGWNTNVGVVLAMVLAAGFFIAIIAIAARVLLGYPLEVGGRKYFIQSAQRGDDRGCFRYAFSGQNYLGIVITMFLKGVQNFLWFLLFLIPGIIKFYSYSMVPYILADNPNIGARKAIQLSRDMTRGHKLDIFVLELSFIGWYLLGLMAFVVGALFVKPYEDATKAELYLVLRRKALERNMCSYEDLGFYAPQQDEYEI